MFQGKIPGYSFSCPALERLYLIGLPLLVILFVMNGEQINRSHVGQQRSTDVWCCHTDRTRTVRPASGLGTQVSDLHSPNVCIPLLIWFQSGLSGSYVCLRWIFSEEWRLPIGPEGRCQEGIHPISSQNDSSTEKHASIMRSSKSEFKPMSVKTG